MKNFKTCILFLFLATAAHSATTGSITLSGVVPALTSIVVTPQTGFNSLDLSSTQSNLIVAVVTESNNTSNGYSVTVTSSNAGNLKNGSLGQVPYTAKYNNISFNLLTTPVQVTNQGSQSASVSTNKNLSISYVGVPNSSLMQGTYSDILTFTITAN